MRKAFFVIRCSHMYYRLHIILSLILNVWIRCSRNPLPLHQIAIPSPAVLVPAYLLRAPSKQCSAYYLELRPYLIILLLATLVLGSSVLAPLNCNIKFGLCIPHRTRRQDKWLPSYHARQSQRLRTATFMDQILWDLAYVKKQGPLSHSLVTCIFLIALLSI